MHVLHHIKQNIKYIIIRPLWVFGMSGTGMFAVDPLGPVCWGVGAPWAGFFPAWATDAQSDRALEDLRVLFKHLGIFVVFFKPFLSSFSFGVSGHIVLLGGHCIQEVLLPWWVVLGSQWCLDVWCMLSSIHINASKLKRKMKKGGRGIQCVRHHRCCHSP